MLAFFRGIIVIIYTLVVCICGGVYCFFSPRNPKHMMTFGHLFGKLSMVFGITIINRVSKEIQKCGPSIYIGNHQNNFDMVTISNVVQPKTVMVGKKNLVLIPFFGFLYWVTGNILIDRSNRLKSYNTILQVSDQIKKNRSLFGYFQKELVIVVVVCYRLNLVLFMLQLQQVFLLCQYVFLIFKTRLN